MTGVARVVAPYAAVLVFWVGLSHGWLAILAYLLQIVAGRRGSGPVPPVSPSPRDLIPALAAAPVGPLVYALAPAVALQPPDQWLLDHRLSGICLLVMIPYFGLLHPVLEQVHWAPLRDRTPLAHPLFAGYHIRVLWRLLPGARLAGCFVGLTATSAWWHELTRRSGRFGPAIACHIAADLGMVTAAWCWMR